MDEMEVESREFGRCQGRGHPQVSGQADRLLTDADITAGKVGYEFDRPADGVT